MFYESVVTVLPKWGNSITQSVATVLPKWGKLGHQKLGPSPLRSACEVAKTVAQDTWEREEKRKRKRIGGLAPSSRRVRSTRFSSIFYFLVGLWPISSSTSCSSGLHFHQATCTCLSREGGGPGIRRTFGHRLCGSNQARIVLSCTWQASLQTVGRWPIAHSLRMSWGASECQHAIRLRACGVSCSLLRRARSFSASYRFVRRCHCGGRCLGNHWWG
jgi:hypothetical protein